MSRECRDDVRGVWESVMRLFPAKMPSSLQVVSRLPLWDTSSKIHAIICLKKMVATGRKPPDPLTQPPLG